MKTSNYSASKVRKTFEKFFDKSVIKRLAKSSEFRLRKDAKITPIAFVVGLIESCCTRINTYSSWASAVGAIIGEEVSKQALFKRMNERADTFASELFLHALSSRLK